MNLTPSMKNLLPLALLLIFQSAHSAEPIKPCRHLEFTELKQMSLKQITREWCKNVSKINDLERSTKNNQLARSMFIELSKFGDNNRKNIEEADKYIFDAKKEINTCNEEQERINEILDPKKGSKNEKKSSLCL